MKSSRSRSDMFFAALNSAKEKLIPKDEPKQNENQLIQIKRYSVSDAATIKREQINSPSKMKYYPQYAEEEEEKQIVPLKKQKAIPYMAPQKSHKYHRVDQDYDIWDLTYTFINMNINFVIIGVMFFGLLIIRYYTLSSLIYIAIESTAHLDWIIVAVLCRVLYFIMVVKISLKRPQSKIQIVLKSHWNSKESDVSEIFQIIDSRLLLISILRGIIPAELSFLYIQAHSKRKQFQIYAAINYTYASIQAIVYYPFIIVYTVYLHVDDFIALSRYYQEAIIITSSVAMGVIVFFSLFLLLAGIKKKYGRVFFCCS